MWLVSVVIEIDGEIWQHPVYQDEVQIDAEFMAEAAAGIEQAVSSKNKQQS